MRSIYYAFVHPHILYGIEIYANTCSTYLKSLNVLVNKLLRTLRNCRLQTPVIRPVAHCALGVSNITCKSSIYPANINICTMSYFLLP